MNQKEPMKNIVASMCIVSTCIGFITLMVCCVAWIWTGWIFRLMIFSVVFSIFASCYCEGNRIYGHKPVCRLRKN